MQTIMFNGKEYECRRYTYDELEQLFDGYLVLLSDAVIDGSDVESGILVSVNKPCEKSELMLKDLKDGTDYEFLDLGYRTAFSGYFEVKEDEI